MGFELRFLKDQSAEIRGIDATNFSVSFIDSVKQCVAKKVLDITINLTGCENHFLQIKESLLKLHQFLATKGHKLKIRGDQLSVADLNDVQKIGIVVLRTSAPPSGQIQSVLKNFELSGKLPSDTSFLADAESQRLEFNQLRERLEKLDTELKTFRTHREIMSKAKISIEKGKKELGRQNESDLKGSKSLEEIAKKKMELSKLTELADEEEKKLREDIRKTDLENKKKEAEFKKEIEAEKGRFQKVQQEFTKKSDARKLEGKKIEAQKAPPEGDPKK